MKKLYFTSIFTFLFGLFSMAQSFSLTTTTGANLQDGDTITVVDGNANASFNLIVWVTNNALTSKYVKAMRTEMSIVNGSENYFCWGNCYDTSVYVSIDSIKMDSKYTEKGFSGDYDSYGHAGKSIIKYTFFDAANPSDKVEFYTEYIAGSGVGIKDAIYEYSISNAYPNPATNNFNINYNFKNAQSARVEILSVIGSVVSSQEISTNSNQARIDISNINNGVYFYNIIVDGRKIESKKLIIHR